MSAYGRQILVSRRLLRGQSDLVSCVLLSVHIISTAALSRVANVCVSARKLTNGCAPVPGHYFTALEEPVIPAPTLRKIGLP